MDTRLQKLLEKEVALEKQKKRKKKIFQLRKEKPLNYYSGWERK